MARSKRGVPGDLAEQLNQAEKEQHAKRNGESLGMVAISGGKEISIEDLVGADIRPDNLYFHSNFTEIEKHLKNPNPDCKYVWKVYDRKNGVKSDAYRSDSLYQGIRSGAYRPVSVDELVKDVNLPISSISMYQDDVAGDVEAVVLKGLVLVEVQPGAAKEEYKQRELVAAMRANPRLGENLMRSSLANMGVKEEQVIVDTIEKPQQ